MKNIFIILILVLNSIITKCQDNEFSQFYANRLYLNPAFAGVENCPTFSMGNRKQWSDINNGIFTNKISYNQYSNTFKGGLGVIILNDNVSNGLMVNNQISLIYSYIININRRYSISFAIQPTIINKRIDYNRFVFGDQLDLSSNTLLRTNEKILNESINFFDISSGLLLYSDDLFIGISAFHLTEPNESFSNNDITLPIRFGFNIAYRLYFNKKNKYRHSISLTPVVLVRNQAGFRQYNIGAYLNYGLFILGNLYRIDESMIHILGIKYKKIRFAYSFDYSVTVYNDNSTHEISLNLNLPCKFKRRKFKALSCPSF